MNCPVCQKEMIQQDFGGVKVDVCKDGCKGIWFDWFELNKLDEKNEGFGAALEEALKFPRTNDENREQIKCPKCNIPMHTHKYQSSKDVNVDECYSCSGFFLDSGEIKSARDTFMSEEESVKYTESLLTNISSYQRAKEDLEKSKERNSAVNKYTKYLQSSYYRKNK
ncbi:MAG TPA: hypothetical protein ENH41_06125 [Candidatus Omnitrophica bacterium]|nr:hypothetical protein [Candidatus Omnitrophota bacterium]